MTDPAPMQQTLLCVNPLILIVDGVFDAATAETVIAAGRDHVAPDGVITDFGEQLSDRKTTHTTRLDQWEIPELAEVATRISSILRLPPENSERAKLLRYRPGERFDTHYDAFLPNETGLEKMRGGGQRLFSSLCYLSVPEKGGHTAFPELKISVRPVVGRVLIWANTRLGSTEPHPHAAHAGLPPEEGEKWALTLFWRQSAWHEPRDFPATDGPYSVY